MLGEIRTSLVQTSAAMVDDDVLMLLDVLPGQAVRLRRRPASHAVSPERFVGVDCDLLLQSQGTVRAVGTVGHHTIVTGGRIIQGSASVSLSRRPDGHRRPWSHYLAMPGWLEITGRGELDNVARAFLQDLTPPASTRTLNLGAVADQAVDVPQEDCAALDRRPPLRMPTGRLRWAVIRGDQLSIRIRQQDGAIRFVLLHFPPDGDGETARTLCENLALHDWLLTTVDHLVRQSGIGQRPPEVVVDHLRPAVDHLVHLWSPLAHHSPLGVQLWRAVDEATGLDWQWQTLVRRIRDQLALSSAPASPKEPMP